VIPNPPTPKQKRPFRTPGRTNEETNQTIPAWGLPLETDFLPFSPSASIKVGLSFPLMRSTSESWVNELGGGDDSALSNQDGIIPAVRWDLAFHEVTWLLNSLGPFFPPGRFHRNHEPRAIYYDEESRRFTINRSNGHTISSNFQINETLPLEEGKTYFKFFGVRLCEKLRLKPTDGNTTTGG